MLHQFNFPTAGAIVFPCGAGRGAPTGRRRRRRSASAESRRVFMYMLRHGGGEAADGGGAAPANKDPGSLENPAGPAAAPPAGASRARAAAPPGRPRRARWTMSPVIDIRVREVPMAGSVRARGIPGNYRAAFRIFPHIGLIVRRTADRTMNP